MNQRRDLARLGRIAACLLAAMVLGAYVLNASKVGAEIEGCTDGCATSSERLPGPVRILSLNVLHGFPTFENLSTRLDLIADEIRRRDADIVCLQEVPWTRRIGPGARYLADRTGLNHIYIRANGNRHTIFFEESEAILSRFPLQDLAFAELKPRAGFFEHRVALQATAQTPWGDLGINVAHLTNGEPDINLAQAESLLTFVNQTGPVPAVIAGDFNAREDSPQIEMLSGHWVDTYQSMSPGNPGPTCCIDDLLDEAGARLKDRIDYVFLRAGPTVRLVSSERILDRPFQTDKGWQWVSDHIGLLVSLEMKNE